MKIKQINDIMPKQIIQKNNSCYEAIGKRVEELLYGNKPIGDKFVKNVSSELPGQNAKNLKFFNEKFNPLYQK